MNHNIRYEVKPLQNLEFSIEITKTGGGPTGPDSLGDPGVVANCMVYNIELGLWWYNLGGIKHWTDKHPDPGAPAGAFEHPSNYSFRMFNPLSGASPHAPFPFDGLYTSTDFTAAHRTLEDGGGVDPATGANWPQGAGKKGYFVYIRATGGGIAGIGEITEYLQLMPFEHHVNVVSWDNTPVSNSVTGYPNVNVSDWGGKNATISVEAVAKLPDINLLSYNSSPASLSTSGLPQVDVQEYKDASVATTTPGIPEVNVTFVNDNTVAADGLENFGASGYDIPTQRVKNVGRVGVINPAGINANSFDNGAITNDAFSDNAISERVVNAATITNEKFDDNAIDHRVIKDGTIKESKFEPNAITAGVIATDAIDEDAIKIDSVTYEEISDSAIREIAAGVWEASVFSPIDSSGAFDGSSFKMGEVGTMGHAMLVNHLSKYMIHSSQDGSGNLSSTPMHYTSIKDPTGEKFYSTALANTPLLNPSETNSYIDRSAVLYRGMSLFSGDTDNTIVFYLRAYDFDKDGWEGAEFSLYGPDGTLVRRSTVDPADVDPNNFINIVTYVKPGLDYTWELTHGADPAGVFISGWAWDYDTESWISVIPAQHAVGADPTVGSFTTPDLYPLIQQQHLVRITEVGEDADGQFFRVQGVDEDGSSIPEGIRPTKYDYPPDPDGKHTLGILIPTHGDVLIIKAETDSTMHEVAHEVWEESVLDHTTPDTFGMLNRITAGLSQYNHRITDSTYDESGRLIACRLVVYPSADDAKNGTNPLTTIAVSSSYDEKQNMKTFVTSEEGS